MAVAYDAFTANAQTGDFSFTHTPTGTPRAVIVGVVQEIGNTDEVTGAVTYGGVACSEMALSPATRDNTDDSVIYAYFLGASIPTGAQTVAIDVDATGSAKRAFVITLTASADTEVVDTTVTSEPATGNDTAVTIQGGATTNFYGVFAHNAVNDPANITPSANWTTRDEHDFTNAIGACYTFDNITTGDQTLTLTLSANLDSNTYGFAVTESAAAAGGAGKMLLMGVG